MTDVTPTAETLVHDPADGNLLAHQRTVNLVSGRSTGKIHPAIAIAWARIRDVARRCPPGVTRPAPEGAVLGGCTRGNAPKPVSLPSVAPNCGAVVAWLV
jgi:hypothetical protein